MNYLVDGWYKFNFLLSPHELEKILEEYHMVIFDAHVPIDYTESSLKEYIAAYSSLYDLLISGTRLNWERNSSLFLQRGVTSNLLNCIYGRIHTYKGRQYKSSDFNEPTVGISPVALWFDIGEDQKLHCSTAYSYITYAENYMGIQLQYPKMIQYQVCDTFEALKSTKELESYRDFERLKKSIKEISHILTIKTAGAERRTDIRISDKVKSQLNGCYSFKQKGVTLK